ncbi:MAG: hypothetical protein ACD_60C00134G0008 [uncultured bacterium]|nr:MAG: hypothetical protein ACD_60C00134G0008 [uncultured bacterium]
MAIVFYPHEDELQSSALDQKLEIVLEAAERYKGIILDTASKSIEAPADKKKRMAPRDITHTFNWEEIARLLREIRELSEANPSAKLYKGERLKKLAEIYEVLRAAKMAKLEAVRIALMNEANQLLSGGSQVA